MDKRFVTIAVIVVIVVFSLSILYMHMNKWSGQGIVTTKEYIPAHTTFIPITHMVGKIPMVQMTPVFHNEKWALGVIDEKGKRHWVTVSEVVYDSYYIGQSYP